MSHILGPATLSGFPCIKSNFEFINSFISHLHSKNWFQLQTVCSLSDFSWVIVGAMRHGWNVQI